MTGVSLTFRTYYNWEGTTDTAYVLGTTDGWATVHQIDKWYSDHGSLTSLGRYTYDISSWADGAANLQIAFKYIGLYDLYWYVDDAELFTPLPPTTVYNHGETVSNLTSLESRAVQYASTWNDPNAGDYEVHSFTSLTTDGDRSNDSASVSVTSYEHYESGGPDAGYYSWNSDKDGGTGSPYNWIDISSFGTPMPWSGGSADDRWTYSVPMGFSFYFYGNTYDRIFVNENGFASFDTITGSEITNYGIPSISGQDNLLALLWDDLDGSVTGSAYYYSNNVDTFIVSFIDWDFYVDHDQRIDMQMILCGSNASIKYQYKEIGPVIYASHTIGIENQPATIGLQFEYNFTPPGNIALPGLAVSFTYNPPTFDVSASSILSPSGTVVVGTVVTPTTVVTNLGSSSATFPVHFEIYDSVNAMIYSNTANVSSLPPLESDTVTFSTFTPTIPGDYSCVSYTVLPGDAYAHNDTTTSTFLADQHYGEGGPDAGRYSWIDNTVVDPNAPVYNWIDITGDGTRVWARGDYDDAYTTPIDMGLTSGFWYYGHDYDSLVICTNGWVSFVRQTSSYYPNYSPPSTSGPLAGVFPLWDDLQQYYTPNGACYYKYDAPNNRFIVSWTNWCKHLDSLQTYNFQVILDGDDGTIVAQYSHPTNRYQYDISLGIQDSTRTIGLRYYYGSSTTVPGTPPLNLPYEGLAIKYYYEPLLHEVAVSSIDEPSGILIGGTTYSIVATVTNNGANTETFNVTAADNRGYSNVQSVAGLAPFESRQVTFPNWTIALACSTYVLTVSHNLPGDQDPANNSMSRSYMAMPASNQSTVYDDGVVTNAWRFLPPLWVIANQFDVPYAGAALSAVSFLFTNLENYPTWPDANRDTVQLYIFTDEDLDGMPDASPIYTARHVPPDHGPLAWLVDCETDISLSCETFWAGWAIVDSLKPEGICMDGATNHPTVCWTNRGGVWAQEDVYAGDDMIRAYFNGDVSQAADINVASTTVNGSAAPGAADTVGNAIDNAAGECALTYTVDVVQDAYRQASVGPRSYAADFSGVTDVANRDAVLASNDIAPMKIVTVSNEKGTYDEPLYPPVIQSHGGPDAYGNFWIDSDDPGGPTFNWVDITGVGVEITSWPHGTVDDGWTDLIPTGMNFSFYGITYSDVVVSTNGWISFLTQTSSYLGNTFIPNTANPNGIVAVEWDDLDGDTLGHCYYYHDSANNRFIVSWVGWPYYAYPDPLDPHDLQVILDGNTGHVIMQYQNGSNWHAGSTVGIENETGSDGLQVAYNATYLHNNLAILFRPAILWLSTDLAGGTLPAGTPPQAFNIFMDAANLDVGTYRGSINIHSNDPDESETSIGVIFTVGGGGCQYLRGDINNNGQANGVDVGYGVNYFKGFGPPPPIDCGTPVGPCPQASPFYAAGDVNGNCLFNGVDITYFVNYLKGIGPALSNCSTCPPGGVAAAPAPVLPTIQPSKAKVIQLER